MDGSVRDTELLCERQIVLAGRDAGQVVLRISVSRRKRPAAPPTNAA